MSKMHPVSTPTGRCCRVWSSSAQCHIGSLDLDCQSNIPFVSVESYLRRKSSKSAKLTLSRPEKSLPNWVSVQKYPNWYFVTTILMTISTHSGYSNLPFLGFLPYWWRIVTSRHSWDVCTTFYMTIWTEDISNCTRSGNPLIRYVTKTPG